ncbi:prenyltransferase/squalene oxidase repeat-containing protein [Maricaulis sp.]|uniref:prenyltransferase/squalene oxidase repeat-containing protein n=1 Tax=Maricaulis sp. TaxID=1486257 RepID=UPI003A939025
MARQIDIAACADHIERLQRPDGSIPWVEAGIWDAWNHGESVMALAIAGRGAAARKALDALFERQDEDGGWRGDLGASVPLDDANRRLVPGTPETARDTNFSGYAAVTLLRSMLALDTPAELSRYWPQLRRAINWVLSHQTRHGDIVWRAPDTGETMEALDSLRAGNASLYKALECAIQIARMLGHDDREWMQARQRLGAALRENDARFDRTGIDRRRYAMDWYYPVLAGVLPIETGRARLYARWTDFVEPGLGCRCVADEPWVTAAETAELALACMAVGKTSQATSLLADLAPLAAKDGGYWMGWQFEEGVIWPYERPSWTAGAMVLAADAIQGLSKGSTLLIRNAVPEFALKRGGAGLPASRRD